MHLTLEQRTAKFGDLMEILHGNKTKGESPVILSICSGTDHKINLNDFVVSNGRYEIPAGTQVRVVKIREPFTDGYTNNCLGVFFENRILWMKHKDLVFENGYVIGRSEVVASV